MKDYSEEIIYQKKRRKIKFFLASVVVFLFLTGGAMAYLFIFTDAFVFKDIEVSGLSRLTKDDLFPSGKKVYLFQNINLDSSILKSWSYRKDIFEKKLWVTVEEREPYAIICSLKREVKAAPGQFRETAASSTEADLAVNNGCFWIDNNGVIIASAPEAEGTLIKSVDDISGRDFHLGDTLLPAELMPHALKIFNLLDDLGIEVLRYELDPVSREEIRAQVKSGPELYFNLRLDPASLREPLKSLVSQFGHLSYIDMRSENKIFYK